MADKAPNPRRPDRTRESESPWALNLGRVLGIPIRLHVTFLLFLGWFAARAMSGSGPDRWYGLVYVCAIFACVVLHELGHSAVAQRYGIAVSEIVLYPIGGLARITRLPEPRQELWIALAGPAVNVVIAAVLYAGLAAAGAWLPWDQVSMATNHWFQQLAAINVGLALFNMVPAFPMDGGRVLRALLALRYGEVRATEVAAIVGQLLAFAFGFVGLLNGNVVLVFVALFVYIGAGAEASMYRGKALTEGIPASSAMVREFHTLPVGASVREAADLLLATSQQDFPVIHAGEVAGVLSRQALLRAMANEGPTAYVSGAMNREFTSVPPDADLQEVAATMRGAQESCVLVMDDGRLAGLITMENLAEFLMVRQLLQRSSHA
jgi:Zn-dependent protease/CBS domain-containing protein